MYELSVAYQYLIPRWRQLSVSIISVISILVIALVVWLIVVFFSVTSGLYSLWTQKLVTVTAPIRITPTEAYYNSYYFHIDSISSNSNYAFKSIGEKANAESTDPYHPDVDEEIPAEWAAPVYDSKGKLLDFVKEAYQIALDQTGVNASDFEFSSGTLHLNLMRITQEGPQETAIEQSVFLSSIDPQNSGLEDILLPVGEIDSSKASQWIHKHPFSLAVDPRLGQGALLPKSYREAGVRIGDKGYLAYNSPTASSMQEQREKIFVAGFYDPGIVSLGGKLILVNKELTSLLRAAQMQEGHAAGNGINLRVENLDQVDQVKDALAKAFKAAGIAPYWDIETYREYEFSKDLMQQLKSERNLFTLLAIVIIIVACSNIISMLIILVNDKKQEIGILRSMGASSFSIAAIFGICGAVMGVLGSLVGIVIALFTLKNLQTLVDLISRVQGYDLLNPLFYGKNLPNAVSADALVFVFVMTALTSLLAGIVPAVKACMLRPSAILKAE